MTSHKYHIVFMIVFLLLILSVSMPLMNYFVGLKTTKIELRERSLPLTVDNIYTEIQKHIIEPNLVSSMMAHDTFLKDWLVNKEEDTQQISKYLEMIKNRYSMFTTFLVSEYTQNYYTEAGLIEKIDKNNKQNKWYFDFKKIQGSHEINLDFNQHIDNSMIMFINHKIFDDKSNLIGVTGIGLKISYINDMLKKFRQQYNFNVYFLNKNSEIVLQEQYDTKLKSLQNIPKYLVAKDLLVSKENRFFEYTREGEEYVFNTKYIPELALYLVVEAKTSQFLHEIKNTFYINLSISLLLSFIISSAILFLVRQNSKKLEYLANHDVLTGLDNRRTFNNNFEKLFLLAKRQEASLTLIFIDIDNFKKINDTLGHLVGDEVLKRLAVILRENTRKSDVLARWGGEEFIIAFFDATGEQSENVSQNLRMKIEEDEILYTLVDAKITASFGLTSLQETDTKDSVFIRLDKALYKAKENGKNQVVVI